MTLPNFIICGTQKGGTTSLYHYLKEHPEVFMSPDTRERLLNYFKKYNEELEKEFKQKITYWCQ